MSQVLCSTCQITHVLLIYQIMRTFYLISLYSSILFHVWTAVAVPVETLIPNLSSNHLRKRNRAIKPHLGILTARWGYGGCSEAQIATIEAQLRIVKSRASVAHMAFSGKANFPGTLYSSSKVIEAIIGTLATNDDEMAIFDGIERVSAGPLIKLDDEMPLKTSLKKTVSRGSYLAA